MGLPGTPPVAQSHTAKSSNRNKALGGTPNPTVNTRRAVRACASRCARAREECTTGFRESGKRKTDTRAKNNKSPAQRVSLRIRVPSLRWALRAARGARRARVRIRGCYRRRRGCLVTKHFFILNVASSRSEPRAFAPGVRVQDGVFIRACWFRGRGVCVSRGVAGFSFWCGVFGRVLDSENLLRKPKRRRRCH